MPRVPVIGRIAAILDAAPVGADSLPASYTYHDLACEVYATSDPTAAQLSAVRRSVAQLVAEGLAERIGRGLGSGAGGHLRQRGGRTMTYRNPAGVMVRRPLTAREQRAANRERTT